MTDLSELAWGIIAAEEAQTASIQIRRSWTLQVKGICTAFQTLSKVMSKENWFHSRDFIFLCRMLRLLARKSERTLFDPTMLLQALRRHFQTLDPSSFPIIANHFLSECGMKAPLGDSLDARVVHSLRNSLQDSLQDGTDPTLTHCRYTLVVDPTDCEASVDLLFALKLLDPTSTKIVSLSEFPEDASPTMITAALAQVKKCIEEGETLLLVNSAPLQSALYDVINRHYAVSVREDGRIDAFANIPLGSFSSLVRVHESFRLVVHVPLSQLPKTPLPFLNRFEKYTLSVRDALVQRVLEVSLNPPHSLRSIPEPEARKRFFLELEAGLNDFVAFAGGITSFYGMSSTETVPALVLRALEDACVSTTADYEPRPSVLAGMMQYETKEEKPLDSDEADYANVDMRYIDSFSSQVDGAGRTIQSISHMAINVDPSIDAASIGHQEGNTAEQTTLGSAGVLDFKYEVQGPNTDEMNARRRVRQHKVHTGSDSYRNDPLPTRLRSFVRALNFQIIETARVESIFRLRDRLPAVYMREYLDHQEHLSAYSLLHQVLKSSLREHNIPHVTPEKLVVYTRTDSHLLRLVTDSTYVEKIFNFGTGVPDYAGSWSSSATSTSRSDIRHYTAIIVSTVSTAPESSPLSVLCVIPLAAFKNSGDCARTVRACMSPKGGRRVIIVVADMKQVLQCIEVAYSSLSSSHTFV
jgi:hypothetical protein